MDGNCKKNYKLKKKHVLKLLKYLKKKNEVSK